MLYMYLINYVIIDTEPLVSEFIALKLGSNRRDPHNKLKYRILPWFI